jgi:hypothetical protein
LGIGKKMENKTFVFTREELKRMLYAYDRVMWAWRNDESEIKGVVVNTEMFIDNLSKNKIMEGQEG